MKKLLATVMALTIVLGVSAYGAHAENFVVDKDMYQKHQAKENNVKAAADATRFDNRTTRGYKKGQYSGSSAYTGGLTGQVAVRNTDPNGKKFVVHPVHGKYNQFGSSLRYGDTSQSAETRINHSFNN